jgi:hypothetical protein
MKSFQSYDLDHVFNEFAKVSSNLFSNHFFLTLYIFSTSPINIFLRIELYIFLWFFF